MYRLFFTLLLLLNSVFLYAAEPALPTLSARITDLTGTLSATQRQQLEGQLAALEAHKGAQIAALMIPTTGDDTIESYAVRTFEQWKLGRRNIDDGLLLVIAKDDRRLRIEVGYGLEGVITDLQSGQIINEQIVPHFQQNDYFGGIQAGLNSLTALIEGEELPPVQPPQNDVLPVDQRTLLIWGGALVLVPLLGRLAPVQWMRRRSLGRYAICSMIVGGLLFLYGLFPAMDTDQASQTGTQFFIMSLLIYPFFLMPVNILMAILASLFNSGGRGGGGLGGGGFRGGGGGSGGGGASGRW